MHLFSSRRQKVRARRQLRTIPCAALPFFLLYAGPGDATIEESESARREYAACLALARDKPDDALEEAGVWQTKGGGLAARHCAALALVELGQYAEAAKRLEKLASQASGDDKALAPEFLGQAANAWLLAGNPAEATAVLNAALKLKPDDPDLLIDRARARASAERWGQAIKDLDTALELAPDRADGFAYRASAKRRANDRPGAMRDVERALQLDPASTEALLERGLLRQAQGDKTGARADWLKVLELAPGSAEAQAARQNIEALDFAAN
jgi:tetratricopeptide (TPR) repeat protein